MKLEAATEPFGLLILLVSTKYVNPGRFKRSLIFTEYEIKLIPDDPVHPV
jgi:hypothetical protein